MENLVRSDEMNPRILKIMEWSILIALFLYAVGAVTSISIMSIGQIFLVIPSIYFLFFTNFKKLPKSAWALLALGLILFLSILINKNYSSNGLSNLSKTRYFFIGVISIAPLQWFFKEKLTDKRLSFLLYTLLISMTASSIYGVCVQIFGHPEVLTGEFFKSRNAGLIGNIMNYAHNMSIVLALIIGATQIKGIFSKIISKKIFLIFLTINLIGFYFSYTRGAWLGLLAAIFFFMIGRSDFRKILLIFGALIAVGFGAYKFAGNKVVRASSDNKRLSQWVASYEIFKERPFLGVGYLNFERESMVIKEKYGIMEPRYQGHAHSNPFEILAAFGVWSLVFYVLWQLLWLKEILYFQNNRIFLLPFIAILIGGLTQSTIGLGVNLGLIYLVYSASFILNKHEK